MNQRAIPYPAAPFPITIPAEIWRLTLDEISRYQSVDSEALVFWGGIVANGSARITGLLLPTHDPQGACVAINRDEARWLLGRLRERDEKLIAQVHSHPGTAYHSSGDDRNAAAYHPGYYSLVIPNYGVGITDIDQCVAHMFDGDAFTPLPPAATSKLVDVTPSHERPRPARISLPESGPRKRLPKWIASKLKRRPTASRRR